VGEVYNLGSGRFISIEDILEKVVSLSTVRVDASVESNPSMFGRNFALSNRIWSDITKLRNLGFEPKFSIDETIKSSLDYWRESYDRL
jgi:nucleoside-diphosphate-sugar epimerase